MFAFGFVFVFVFEFVSVFLCLVESHFSLLIVKSLSGNQSGVAAPAFLVVSRHNLNISRFDLDHNLPNICSIFQIFLQLKKIMIQWSFLNNSGYAIFANLLSRHVSSMNVISHWR